MIRHLGGGKGYVYRGEHFACMNDLRRKYGLRIITPAEAKEARLKAMARAKANGSMTVRVGGRRMTVA